MILLRQRNFSKKKEEKKNKKDDLKIAGGALVAGDAANIILHKLHDHGSSKSSEKISNLAENPELSKKIVEEAKKQGIKAGTPVEVARDCILQKARKTLGKDYKLSVSDELTLGMESRRGAEEISKSMNGMGAAYFRGLNAIVSEKELPKTSAGTLSHELGHAKNIKETGGSKLGRLAHKVSVSDNVGILGSLGAGFASGYRAEKKKEKGEKVSTLNKLTPAITALALSAPVLIKEGAATRQGIKDLKKYGASKEYIKAVKKELGHAFGTYVHGTAGSYAVSGYTGRLAGRGVRKLQHKKQEELRKHVEEENKDK